MTKELVLAPSMIAELLDMIHNALLVINSNQKIIFTNRRAAAMFRTDEQAFLGHPFSSLFMPDDVEIFAQNIIRVIHRNGEITTDAMFYRQDGTSFLGRLAATRFRWNDGQEGVIFSIHDITDVKQLEKSLRQCERIAFLGRLIDDISHQIRNPITAIGGYVRRIASGRKEEKAFDIILEEAGRLERLLDSINRFARLPGPVIREISLAELMEDLNATVGKKVEERGCTWKCRCTEKLLGEKLLIDPDLFLEALLDVAINGCESYDSTRNRKDRQVRCIIEASSNDAYPVVFKIEDDGMGVAEHARDHIFSHFYSDKTGHLGMGLSFARRIIEEQGGQMIVESKPDDGTTVSFLVTRERRRTLRVKALE